VIAGIDGEFTNGFLRETQSLPSFGPFPEGVHYDYEIDAVSVSGFVQIERALTDRLTAQGAARLDHTRYAYDNRTASNDVGRFRRPADRTDRFLTVSPKFSLLYEIGAGVGRVSYARGARPPQTSDLYRLQPTQGVGEVDPERIDAVEIGWRGAAADWLQLDAAAFWMEKRNFFFRDADGLNVPDGRTRHVGVEAEATARLPADFTLSMNATYAAHTYRFDRPVGNATETISKGDDVDTAPRWLAGVRLLWAPELPVSAEAEWVFVGGYFTNAANTETYPGHNLLNLRAQWRPTPHVAVFAALRNALDTLYAERADFAFGNERYFPGEERNLALGVRLSN